MRRATLGLLGIFLAGLVAGCNGGGRILANPPLDLRPPAATPTPPPRPADPIPVVLPRDDGPHDRLTEWWYYTGHLRTPEGRRFGFEAVVFRAERGGIPTGWASHVALTDEFAGRFTYAQRSWIGAGVDHSPRGADGQPTGFDLVVGPRPASLAPSAAAPSAAAAASPATWRLAGSSGQDAVTVAVTAAEAEGAAVPFGFDLRLRALKPAVLHDGDGFVDFGPAGTSYYYSRTRMEAAGSLEVNGERLDVTGIAWFDHQWGDFVSVGGGGWDWFAINLDDGTDVTLSRVLDATGSVVLAYGTVVDRTGAAAHLAATDFVANPARGWTSPRTGLRYELGWEVSTPSTFISLRPTLDDQELDTRATTGVAYWEGSHSVAWSGVAPSGEPIGGIGDAYVEMTRYAALGPGPATPLPTGTGAP